MTAILLSLALVLASTAVAEAPAAAAPAIATPAIAESVEPAPEPPSIPELLIRAEEHYGLPAGLLHAIAWVESRMDPAAVGPCGEVGLMQLHPRWHDVSGGVPGQIDTAAAYLAEMIRLFGLDRGIAAYNAGPTHANPKSAYVRRVYRAWDVWREERPKGRGGG